MKYSAYITRGEHWYFDSRDLAPITEAEWLEYARSDPELRLVTHHWYVQQDTGQGWLQPRQNEHVWEWTCHSCPDNSIPPEAGQYPGFFYHRNGIIVGRPDSELLAKAKAIARAFNARVIGDDDDVL